MSVDPDFAERRREVRENCADSRQIRIAHPPLIAASAPRGTARHTQRVSVPWYQQEAET